MTSISSLLGGFSPHRMHSAGERMQSMLQSAVSGGTVQSADQTALSGALGDIATAMRANASSAGADTASTTDTGDATSMKDKIDGLIDQEVTDGKLTGDQAGELRDLFSKAAEAMAAGGPQGPGGPPPPPPPSNGASDLSVAGTDGASSASTTGTSSSSIGDAIETVASDAMSALTGFLDKLKHASQSSSLYGASGSTASSLASVLVNAVA